ncbi:hypothetical protein [Paenibacillus sp. Leaf72]|uniref:hypothetical protein n=1 Tax=Paenibacillus sp. Leaf72 TaxID=1736234 RepID=UPI0012DCC64C|nr:hypothetical protein [Paenibacillus sp. Leaf72]
MKYRIVGKLKQSQEENTVDVVYALPSWDSIQSLKKVLLTSNNLEEAEKELLKVRESVETIYFEEINSSRELVKKFKSEGIKDHKLL